MIRRLSGARGSRPNGPYRINRQSPQARNLAMWVPVTPNRTMQFDVVRGIVFGAGNDVTDISVQTSTHGFAIDQSGGTAPFGMFLAQDTFGVGVAGQTTAVWLPPHVVDFEVSGAFIKLGSGGDGFGLGLGTGTLDTFGSEIVGLVSGIRWVPTGVTVNRAIENLLAITLNNAGNGFDIYHNGRLIYSDTSGGPGTLTPITQLFGEDTIRSPWGKASDFKTWNRALTAADHWALYDPVTRWDLYAVPSSRSFFDMLAPPSGQARIIFRNENYV